MVNQFFRADGLAALALVREVRLFAVRHAHPGCTVLDLGCGAMPYRGLFTTCGARYIGADIDGQPDLLIGVDGCVPLSDSSVDIVVSFQVLEHVQHVSNYLATVRRVLRPGGRVFLSTHGVWPYHPHPTDFWRWTRDGLRLILEDGGFTVHQLTPLCGPAAWIAMFPMLALHKAAGTAWPLLVPANLLVNAIAWAADCLTPATIRDTNAAIFAVELSKGA